MARQIGAGTVLRRGANKLTAGELLEFTRDKKAVASIIKEIDARRDVYLETEKDATAALAKLEVAQTTLAEGQTKLAKDQEMVKSEFASIKAEHDANMATQTRRKRELDDQATAQVDREGSECSRVKEAARIALVRENELTERERVVEDQETALEDKQVEFVKADRAQSERRLRIETAATMVKKAVAGL